MRDDLRATPSTNGAHPCQPLWVADVRPRQLTWLFGAFIAAGCGGGASDTAAPTGTATIGGSTGDSGDESSTTTGPTSAGVTSAVPTTETQTDSNSDPSDPTLDPSDTDSDCLGCINAAGICESGEFDDACGRGGSPCLECEAPAVCAEGLCESPPGCSPDNCDGCCDGDDCIATPSDAACGAGGDECTPCDSDATCNNGICELPCEDTCFGCCTTEGECIEDADSNDDACGFLGFECEACTGDQFCDFGVCSSPGCIETCDGCCIGNDCFSGFDNEACGFNGACEVCADGLTCDAFGLGCELSQLVQWQVVLLSGSIVPTQPGGGTWDAFGGAPDPYLDIAELEFMSTFVDNTVDPVWNETVTEGTLTPDLQQPLTFRMRDSDVLLDQEIGTCMVTLPDDAFGGPYEVTCSPGGDFAFSVLLSIQTVQK